MVDRRPGRLYRRLAVLVAVLLVVVAAKMLSIGWFASAGASAYDDGQYRISEADYRKLLVVNVVERWKAPNNVGVAQYRQADYVGAERSFTDALGIAPERCDVRYNLVISIEAQADALAGDGDTSGAGALYDRAIEVIRAGDCPIQSSGQSTTSSAPPDSTQDSQQAGQPDEQSGDPGEKLDQAEQRIDGKRRQGSSTSSSTPDSSPDSTTATTAAPPTPNETQQRQLDERTKRAQQERREEQQRTTSFPEDRTYDQPRW